MKAGKKVKIIASTGPSCNTPSTIRAIIEAGADCFRINTAFGDIALYKNLISYVRKVKDIPIMLDLKGADIRLNLKKDVELKKGDKLKIGFIKGENHFTKEFYKYINLGDKVLFQNGFFVSKVIRKQKKSITLKFFQKTIIKSGAGVNIPKDLEVTPVLTEKDKEVCRFAKKNRIEYLALSFTRTPHDILILKKKVNDPSIGLIAKIENQQGVNNADKILEHCDGLMVARGDLGIEVPHEKLPLIQKYLINVANQKGKIAITATEMLQSMTENPIPTRAEVSDVANAILDGTDAVMLNDETGLGKHPVQSVKETEAIIKETVPYIEKEIAEDDSISEVVTHAVETLCDHVDKIITVTKSGFTARMIARFRNNKEIIAVTNDYDTKRKLEIVFGITPVYFKKMPKVDLIKAAVKFTHKKKLIKSNETVLITAGAFTKKQNTNTITVVKVKDVV
ncbi:pyruvate kinase [Nanoarchaeota archaeon]